MSRDSVDLIVDDRFLAPEELKSLPHARCLTLQECLPLLASPDSGAKLALDGEDLSDGTVSYQLLDGLPILVPTRLRPFFDGRVSVPFERASEQFLQYFLLAAIKQQGEINAPATSLPYHRHLARVQDFVGGLSGTLLDVGCDDPSVGAALLPEGVAYVGLDPFCGRTDPFRVIGVGECLPFGDGTFDNVLFNTSLDHIFDWHLALDEAKRVLRPSGSLVIMSYVWTERADLLNDTVHFHHFRDYEILGHLMNAGFVIEDLRRYACPKGDSHRHELFVRAASQSGEVPSRT